MNYFPVGRPATCGSGAKRYTLRIPLWPAENVRLDEFDDLQLDEVKKTTIGHFETTIQKRQDFFVLKVLNFGSTDEAKIAWRQLTVGLIRLTAATGAALQFPSSLAEIARDEDQNLRFREELNPSVYPLDWAPRSDNTKTDGGIFSTDACILPEHERIWEYPQLFGRIVRIAKLSQLGAYQADKQAVSLKLDEEKSICLASHALWLACAQNDRGIANVLLVTALEALAMDERVPNWSKPIEPLISEIQTLIRKSKCGHEGARKTLLGKIRHIGSSGSAERVRALIFRAFGANGSEAAPSLKSLQDKRGAFVHGGSLDRPTADEIERLREIFRRALDRKLQDLKILCH